MSIEYVLMPHLEVQLWPPLQALGSKVDVCRGRREKDKERREKQGRRGEEECVFANK